VVFTTPVSLHRRDQAPEVAVRPHIARGPGDRQQPFPADPTLRRRHLLGDQRGHVLVVASAGGPGSPGKPVLFSLEPLDDPLDGLGGRAADRGRGPIGANLLVGGNDAHHSVPRRLQWSSLGGEVTGFDTATPPSRGSRSSSTRRARGGDFCLATSGDRHLATCEDFLMAMDIQQVPVQRLRRHVDGGPISARRAQGTAANSRIARHPSAERLDSGQARRAVATPVGYA